MAELQLFSNITAALLQLFSNLCVVLQDGTCLPLPADTPLTE